jgi:hypothetical protein
MNFFDQIFYQVLCQEFVIFLREVKVSFDTLYHFFVSQSFNEVSTAVSFDTLYHFFVSQSFNEVSTAFNKVSMTLMTSLILSFVNQEFHKNQQRIRQRIRSKEFTKKICLRI